MNCKNSTSPEQHGQNVVKDIIYDVVDPCFPGHIYALNTGGRICEYSVINEKEKNNISNVNYCSLLITVPFYYFVISSLCWYSLRNTKTALYSYLFGAL